MKISPYPTFPTDATLTTMPQIQAADEVHVTIAIPGAGEQSPSFLRITREELDRLSRVALTRGGMPMKH